MNLDPHSQKVVLTDVVCMLLRTCGRFTKGLGCRCLQERTLDSNADSTNHNNIVIKQLIYVISNVTLSVIRYNLYCNAFSVL